MAAIVAMAAITAVSAGVSAYGASQQSDAAEEAAALQSDAATSAAQLQKESADQSLAFQRKIYNQTRRDLLPWKRAGVKALGALDRQMQPGGYLRQPFSFTGKDFRADPGYQFRLAEGQKALERSAAAKGDLLSGATLQAANVYGQNVASEEYGKVYGRAFTEFNTNQANRFNKLAALAGIGQQATNTGIQAGQQYGSSVTGLLTAAGNAQAEGLTGAANAQAAGRIGSANAWAQGYGNIADSLNSGLSNYYMLSQMNA